MISQLQLLYNIHDLKTISGTLPLSLSCCSAIVTLSSLAQYDQIRSPGKHSFWSKNKPINQRATEFHRANRASSIGFILPSDCYHCYWLESLQHQVLTVMIQKQNRVLTDAKSSYLDAMGHMPWARSVVQLVRNIIMLLLLQLNAIVIFSSIQSFTQGPFGNSISIHCK